MLAWGNMHTQDVVSLQGVATLWSGGTHTGADVVCAGFKMSSKTNTRQRVRGAARGRVHPSYDTQVTGAEKAHTRHRPQHTCRNIVPTLSRHCAPSPHPPNRLPPPLTTESVENDVLHLVRCGCSRPLLKPLPHQRLRHTSQHVTCSNQPQDHCSAVCSALFVLHAHSHRYLCVIYLCGKTQVYSIVFFQCILPM